MPGSIPEEMAAVCVVGICTGSELRNGGGNLVTARYCWLKNRMVVSFAEPLPMVAVSCCTDESADHGGQAVLLSVPLYLEAISYNRYA